MQRTATYLDAETSTAEGANGVSYAYRRVGPSDARPLVLLQHFRGNLENWDPALIDALSATHDVIVFDNRGVGATSGTTPTTFAMATTPSPSSRRSASTTSTCSGSRSAASSRRRSH